MMGATMAEQPVLIVGAGLAGLSAAVALAEEGISVCVIDQAPRPGGAIHRQPLPGIRSIATGGNATRWRGLMAQVSAQAALIDIRCETRFGGLDYQGKALLTGKGGCLMAPRALILATGARERVQPRPGWTLPGVMTAGALQSGLKTTAEGPRGRVLLAGSGPLLLAVGAELVRLGTPPAAIVEAARPFSRPLHAVRLPRSYLAEATAYLLRLRIAGVPLLTGHHLTSITHDGQGLVARIQSSGRDFTMAAETIALHDGIASNDFGLPQSGGIPVLRLGDCRQALGARAALADGRAGGTRLAAILTGQPITGKNKALSREEAAQARLARIYAHDGLKHLDALPADTILCRCENRSLADLRALGPAPTDRQMRLDGRFAMGPCQGRFCAEWVRHLSPTGTPSPTHLGANRWPTSPLSISDLVDAPEESL